MMKPSSEIARRSDGCCHACHHVKLESATPDYLAHSVLHTESSVMKPDFSGLSFSDAALQPFTPTSDFENQLLNSMPGFNIHHGDIPAVSSLDRSSNHFVSGGGMNPSTTSLANDLLLCQSVFDSNPSMSQYASNYNTIPQTSHSMWNASHPPAVMGSIISPRAINAASFAAEHPFHHIAPLPNYDVDFHHPSQMQTPCEINVPPLDFNYYNHWLPDAGFNTEGAFSF